MKNPYEYRIGTGASAMLLIFVILSIVTLGVLSLMSAKSDQALTVRNIYMITKYYQASAKAQARIKEVDDALPAMSDETGIADYARREGMTYSAKSLSFSEDAGENRSLIVTLQIGDNSVKAIERYSLENTGIWTGDTLSIPFGEVEDTK